MRSPYAQLGLLFLVCAMLWPFLGPTHTYYRSNEDFIVFYFYGFMLMVLASTVIYVIWFLVKATMAVKEATMKLFKPRVSKSLISRPESKALTPASSARELSSYTDIEPRFRYQAERPPIDLVAVNISRSAHTPLKKKSSILFSDFRFHRTLSAIEMNLSEMFRTLSAQGVDNRRDRMSDIATGLEAARNGSSVRSNRDVGSHQETARHIIDVDSRDLAKFREKRRDARNMAFAFELLLKQSPLEARNYIIGKQIEALTEGKKLPFVIPALALILEINLNPTSAAFLVDAVEESPNFGRVLRCVFTSKKIWKHPSQNLRFKSRTSPCEVVELFGWQALDAMRNV